MSSATCGIGVHVGCSSLCISSNVKGKVDIVANAGGDRTTPAFITMQKDDIMVGQASKQSSHRYPNKTVTHLTKLLGKNFDETELNNIKSKLVTSCTITEKKNKLIYEIPIGDNNKIVQYTPMKLLTLLLKNALSTAQSYVGTDVNEVVVTVPDDASTSFKDELSDAMTNAGFEVLRLLTFSTAAAIGYNVGFEDVELEPYKLLVVRIGGQSSSLTLLEVIHGMISIIATASYNSGGDILTDDLANHFASIFQQKYRASIKQNEKAMRKLKMNSEKCKQVLSTIPTAACHIDSLFDGIDFNGNISRSRFEVLVANHLSGFLEPIKQLLSENKLTADDISKVILSGGTCNIPVLGKMVASMLPNAEILSSIPPEEVSAFGCARECGLLSNQEFLDVKSEDCKIVLSPGDIYIKIGDEFEHVVSFRTVLPVIFEKKVDVEKVKSTPFTLFFKANGNEDKTRVNEIPCEKFTGLSQVDICLRYMTDGHISFTVSNEDRSISEHVTVKCA